jgi:hypothetical protein
VFARCSCVDVGTGARLGRRCPLLGQPGHGSWYFAAELPAQAGRRQRLRRGGYPTRVLAVQARDGLLAEPTGHAAGRAWTLERWLNRWLLDVGDCLRPTTVDGYRKHAQGNLIPMLGHVKLAGVSRPGPREPVIDALICR